MFSWFKRKITWNKSNNIICFRLTDIELNTDAIGKLVNLRFMCSGYHDSNLLFSGNIYFGNQINGAINGSSLEFDLRGEKITKFIEEFSYFSNIDSTSKGDIYYQSSVHFKIKQITAKENNTIFNFQIDLYSDISFPRSIDITIDIKRKEFILSNVDKILFYRVLTHEYYQFVQYELYVSPDAQKALIIGKSHVWNGHVSGNFKCISIDDLKSFNLAECILESNKYLLKNLYIDPEDIETLGSIQNVNQITAKKIKVEEEEIERFRKENFASVKEFAEYGYFSMEIKDGVLNLYRIIQWKKSLTMKIGNGAQMTLKIESDTKRMNEQLQMYIKDRWCKMRDNGKSKDSLEYL